MNLNEGSYLFKIPQLCTNLFQLFFHRLTQTTLILLIHPFLVTSLSSFSPNGQNTNQGDAAGVYRRLELVITQPRPSRTLKNVKKYHGKFFFAG